jgi:HSP20 family molecular chaperone IbpA
MAVMRPVGNGHQLPPHAHVRADSNEYVISLDVSDFTEEELTIELLGPHVTVRGDQRESAEDEARAFHLHERLEESFRLPDDAVPERIKVFYEHGTLVLHAPRRTLVPRLIAIERKPLGLINPDATPC